MSKKIYFPGLNALRFFSAFAVIITHVELMKQKLEFSNFWTNTLIHNLGVMGVSFFFVLSGFLITYLLLEEKNQKGLISIKHFYFRRILRIWPLYFLILILGFFILPNFSYVPFFSEKFNLNYYGNLLFYLLILPNFALSFYHSVPLIGQTWSIGVEEQFYLIWPIFFHFKKIKFNFLIVLFFIWVFLKGLVLFSYFIIDNGSFLILKKVFSMLKFENMIIGAIGALVVFNSKEKILAFIFNPFIFTISLFAPFLLLFFLETFMGDIIHILHSLFFIIIILNVSINPKSFLKLENKMFNFLGSISYGIYMYHMIVIYLLIKLLSFHFDFSFKLFYENILLHLLSLVITVLISNFSYKFFEKIFLNWKLKYSHL